MRFTVLSILLFVSTLSLAQKRVSAGELLDMSRYTTVERDSFESHGSCTERCHVGFMAYEVEFEYAADKREVFRHGRHLFNQEIDCISCHNDSLVNTEGHGKLLINRKDCLSCHHVESEELKCNSCHLNIDATPMKFNNEKFVHGFTVYDDVDCRLCHQKDPTASLKKEIDCIKCHHTTPDLDCIKCHEEDLTKSFVPDKIQAKKLLWSVDFDHSAHPDQEVRCNECHVSTRNSETGIEKYNVNCSKCHHLSDEERECIKCHKEPFEFSRGKKYVEGIAAEADLMSRAVSCEECHLFDKETFTFLGVKGKCIGCHNKRYGELHDAWITAIEKRTNIFSDPELDTLQERDKNLMNLVKKYGMHNFNLARLLLDYLDAK
ncbi:MAG: hypothetical protein SCALA701_30310 [Candidatus Scalindua sp.]|nr:hypothetical protein [Planctomycetota bacterium]GJQ60230.1 MAG: hypothetical protein SCALA701_30310 [Candidatus Scalindua sp.]